jgi:hypothetical protein
VSENSLIWNFIVRDNASRGIDTIGGKMTNLAGVVVKSFGVAAVGGIAAFGAAMVSGIKSAQSYQDVVAATAAVIKSTGNAAHISVDGLKTMAGQLETLSGVDEELILHGENVLATFTRVRNEVGKGNDIFNQATQAALNMSVALGEDLQSANIQLGKALNDPIKGLAALQRVGVMFTASQKEQIKTMVASGNIMGAQKVILKELTTEFGGAAKAAGGGLSGAIAHLKDVLSDGARDIATQYLPQLTNMTNWFSDRAPQAVQFTADAIEKIGKVIAGESKTWGPLISNGLSKVLDVGKMIAAQAKTWGPAISDGVRNGLDIGKSIGLMAKGWANTIIAGIRTGMDTGDWSSLGESLGKGLVVAVGKLGNFVAAVTGKISDWMSKIDWVGIGIAMGKQAPSLLVGLAAGLLNFDLWGLLKGLGAHWLEILLAVLALAFTPVKIVGKVGELLAKIPLVGKLLEWGLLHFKQFSDKMVNIVIEGTKFFGTAFMEGFRRVFPGVGQSFAAWLSLLPTRVGLIAIEIAEKAKAMIEMLAGAIKSKAGSVISRIGELIAQMLSKFIGADRWLLGRGYELLTGLLSGIRSNIGNVLSGIALLITGVLLKFVGAERWLYGKGRDVLTGFLDGLKSAWSAVTSWVGGIGTWIKDHKGPISLDRQLLVPAGHAIMDGFLTGLKSGTGKAWDFVKGIGGKSKEMIASAFGWIGDVGSGVGSWISNMFSGGGGGGKSGVAAGVQQWAGVASQALALAGAPQSWLPSLLARMQRESGGNPRAINLWDSNAKAGTPSIGLMQTIGPTFSAYAGQLAGRGIYDPLANIYAAIRYTIARYGSGPAGWNRAGGYDSGGWLLPGTTLATNLTGKPEAIFTHSQLEEFKGGGKGTTIIFQHSGPLIGNNVEDWLTDKIDTLRRQRRI